MRSSAPLGPHTHDGACGGATGMREKLQVGVKWGAASEQHLCVGVARSLIDAAAVPERFQHVTNGIFARAACIVVYDPTSGPSLGVLRSKTNGTTSTERRRILERPGTGRAQGAREVRDPDRSGCEEAWAYRGGGTAESDARGYLLPRSQAVWSTTQEVIPGFSVPRAIAAGLHRGSAASVSGRPTRAAGWRAAQHTGFRRVIGNDA